VLAAAAAAEDRPPHVVYISIVGCDANPFPYYRAKADAERVLRQAGIPATVVRATQFHTLAAAVAGALTLGPLALTLGDLAFQPVDARWVAARLVDTATAAPPTGFRRATDLAGPEVLTMADVARALRRHAGHPDPHVVRLPPLGGVLRAFSAHTNLPGPGAETGGTPFGEWLAARNR
jgi:uncharacterized protein YbjT (DUF2867 family)